MPRRLLGQRSPSVDCEATDENARSVAAPLALDAESRAELM